MLYCAPTLAVADEIDERKRFLDEMRAMGQGAKYEHLIQGEIAEARTAPVGIPCPRVRCMLQVDCLLQRAAGFPLHFKCRKCRFAPVSSDFSYGACGCCACARVGPRLCSCVRE